MTIKARLARSAERSWTSSTKYVTTVDPASAAPHQAAVIDEIRRDFGAAVPPLMVHSAVPDLFEALTGLMHATLVSGRVPRFHKEAVSAAVSRTNRCPYCVDVHTLALDAVHRPDLATAIQDGAHDRIRDPHLRGLVRWAASTRRPDSEILKAPPFGMEDAPEIIGTAVAFHYINRVVNVFLPASPLPVESRLPGLGRLGRQVAKFMIGDAVQGRQPIKDTYCGPDLGLPADLSWASGAEPVRRAVGQFAAATDAAGERSVPPAARQLLLQWVQAWRGEDPGLGAAWVEAPLARLDESDAAAARLCLLVACASYRVDEQEVARFRVHHPGDDTLIDAVAWASFAAARRIGGWLSAASEQPAMT